MLQDAISRLKTEVARGLVTDSAIWHCRCTQRGAIQSVRCRLGCVSHEQGAACKWVVEIIVDQVGLSDVWIQEQAVGAHLQSVARSKLAFVLHEHVHLGAHVALRESQGGAREVLVGVVEIEYLVSKALLGKHVSINLFVFLLVGTTFAIGLGLIAWTFIDLLVVLDGAVAARSEAISELEVIVVCRTHQRIVVAIRSSLMVVLMSLLLFGLELVAFFALSDLGLTPEHVLLVLELELAVRGLFARFTQSLPLVIS